MKDKSIKIAPLILEKYINTEICAVSKTEVINEMIDLIADGEILIDKNKFLNSVIEREDLCSTGLENGVAFIHPRFALDEIVSKPVIAIGISKKGIDFESIDDEPTYIFFVLCFNKLQNHLHYLAYLSRLCKDGEFLDALKEADKPEDILEIIKEKEKDGDNLKVPSKKSLYSDGIMSFYRKKK
ncbi:PTS sugar transporter subunit IIA [Candidatus Desantisbacteria bacterium]|nr:PTS sugar transporter subunit IIA [Candidatus Desantisbacteria bacterium]